MYIARQIDRALYDFSSPFALLLHVKRHHAGIAQAVPVKRVLRLLHVPGVRVRDARRVRLMLSDVHRLFDHPGNSLQSQRGEDVHQLHDVIGQIASAVVVLGTHVIQQPSLVELFVFAQKLGFSVVRVDDLAAIGLDDDLPRNPRELTGVVHKGIVDRERARHFRGKSANTVEIPIAVLRVRLRENRAAGQPVGFGAHADVLVCDFTRPSARRVVLGLRHSDRVKRVELVDPAIAHVRGRRARQADQPRHPRGDLTNAQTEQRQLGGIVDECHDLFFFGFELDPET